MNTWVASPFWLMVNNAVLNMFAQISQHSYFISFGIYPEMELLDHMVTLFLKFWGITILSSTIATPLPVLTSGHRRSSFSSSSPALFIFGFFIVAIWLDVRCIWLPFPNDQWGWASFHVLTDRLCMFSAEISVQVLRPPICLSELPVFRTTCVHEQGWYLLSWLTSPLCCHTGFVGGRLPPDNVPQPVSSLPSAQTLKISFHAEKITCRWGTDEDRVSSGKNLRSGTP